MKEKLNSGWKKVEISPGHFIEMRPIDPKILAQMPPPGSKNFMQRGIIEFTVAQIKKDLQTILQ